MAKAKLVTRSATTSTVTDDNLNKASALTHAEMDSNLINLRDSSFGIADDSSTVLQVTHDKTITIAGSGTVGTALSGDTLTITGSGITATSTDTLQNKTIDTANNTITITESDISDLGSYITASSTDTLTNKTFDANGTGNSISNIETADIAAATLVTAADTIASNNNDTTIPTSAAVKAYADSVGGGGGGTITALNNQAENRLVSIGSTTTELDGEANLTFDGSTLTLTGSAALDGVTIADNVITTNRSNDDLRLSANGTGRIGISTDGSDFWNNALYNTYYGNPNGVVKTLGVSSIETVDANTAARNYVLGISQNTTLSGSSASNTNFRQRTLNLANSMDMAGYSFTQASLSRGPKAASFGTNVVNSSATASTLYPSNAAEFFVSAWGESGYAEGNLTITEAVGVRSIMEIYSAGGTGNFTFTNAKGFLSGAYVDTNDTITNHYLYHAQPGNDGAGGTITNSYGYYVASSTGGVGTNYAFYDASNSLSVFGDIQTQAVSITDNHITTNRSNDNLYIQANGTGRVNLGDVKLEDTAYWADLFGNPNRIKGNALTYEDLSVNPNDLTDRELGHGIYMGTKITASSTNSNFRPRAALIGSVVDLAGFNYTNTNKFRGPLGAQIYGAVLNGTSTDVTINSVRGVESSASVADFTGTSGAITIVEAVGNMAANFHERNGTGDINITNDYGFRWNPEAYHASGGTGVTTITNSYGFHVSANNGNATVTNAYAFYSTDATASSRMGAIRLDNQSGDPTHGADFSWIYAKDDASSSEVYVKDEAGNVTKISPHNTAGDWEYYSVNSKTGKTVRVNMERMIRRLEEITGETFIESE